MAWYRAGGSGIPASVKTNMNNVLNKKMGTSGQVYPPTEWADDVNLMGMLEVKTASGAIASFSDGADDVPISDCKFSFSPKQASGTPSPSNPLAITGWTGLNIVHGKKNLINFVGNVRTTTSAGLTMEATTSGGIRMHGTTTQTYAYLTSRFDCFLKAGATYTFSRDTAKGYRLLLNCTYADTTTGTQAIAANATSKTFKPDKDIVQIRLETANMANATAYDDTILVMVETGETATDFEKYVTPETKAVTWTEQGTIYGGYVTPDKVVKTHVLVPFSDCTWASVTSYQSNFDSTNGIVSLRFGKTAMTNAGYAQNVSKAYCNVFDNQNRSVWNNANRLYEIGYSDGISFNVLYSDIGLSEWTSNATNTLNAFRASQLYQNGYFALELADYVEYSIADLNLSTYYGDNNFWSEGDTAEVTYRGSGATTIITPTLVSKNITANGTYDAEDDNADGYDTVTVNVAGTAVRIPTVLFVQSKNRGSANTFTYTFTEAGTFQYLVSMSGNSTPTTANLTVSLNNTALTPSSFSNGDLGFFYGEITVAADDVLTVTTTADSNRGAQVFVFKDADVTNFSLVAWRGNDGGTFAIQTNANVPFLEVYKTGYYETRNNFNYVIAMLSSNSAGMESTPTPANYANYYYGFTYVITI